MTGTSKATKAAAPARPPTAPADETESVDDRLVRLRKEKELLELELELHTLRTRAAQLPDRKTF